MGAFFTNVQVQMQGFDEGQARTRLLAALKEWLAAGGDYLEGAEEDADRTVIVAPNGKTWWSIYDQNTEDQGPTLQELGMAMSARLDARAVSVLMHDGDVLDLCLYENGRVLDEYNSDPAYFDQAMPDLTLSSEEKERLKGNADLWKGVLPRDTETERLRAAWGSHDRAGMEILQGVAEVIGWTNERAFAGFNSLEENEDLDVLFFRLKRRAASALRAEGPPRFAYDVNMLPTVEREYTGKQAFEVSVHVLNIGGRLTGLRVEVSGEGVNSGAAEITDIAVRCGAGAALSSRPTAASDGVIVAEFPDAELPAGLADPGYVDPMEPVKMNEHHPVVFKGEELDVRVGGFLVALGSAELEVALVPGAAPTGVRFVHTFRAIVKERPQRPEPFPGMALFLERASGKQRE